MFHDRGGVDAAHRVVRERSGRWFDPALARIVLAWRADDPWWALLRGDVGGAVVAAEPSDRVMEVDDDGLDGVARAFADIIDAKSPFTFRHSTRVANDRATRGGDAAGSTPSSSGASIAPACCTTSASSASRA